MFTSSDFAPTYDVRDIYDDEPPPESYPVAALALTVAEARDGFELAEAFAEGIAAFIANESERRVNSAVAALDAWIAAPPSPAKEVARRRYQALARSLCNDEARAVYEVRAARLMAVAR